MDRTRSPLRQAIDQQRVQVWYEWLRFRSGGATAYALEKELIRDGFARAVDGSLSHRNRMARYALGKHVPRAELVAQAEARFPGSRGLLEHPYWQILDPDQDISVHASAWLAGLSADVQRIMFKPGNFGVDGMIERRPITSVPLRQLENLGTFGALAATALLLRETLKAGNQLRALYCAVSFWRLLLLISSSIPFFEALPAMAKLADQAILQRVVYDDEQVCLSSVPIRCYEMVLRDHCLAQEDAGELGPSHASWVRERLLLIRGKKGFDLLHAFRLPMAPTSALRADPTRYLRFVKEETIRFKALEYCLRGLWKQRSFADDMMAFYDDPDGRWPAFDDRQMPVP